MKDWRRRWQRYRRQNRFLVGLYLVLLLLAGGAYALFSRMAGLPAEQLTNRLLTFLLWWFDLTLIAILLFILLRNFLKLALERHYGILGSRFRTKLLLSYFVLILVPTSLLFLLSAVLLSGAANAWFSEPVERMARAGVELAGGVRAQAEARTQRAAGVIADRLRGIATEPERLAELERLHAELGDHLTGLLHDGMPVVELADPHQHLLQRLAPLPPEVFKADGVRGERFGGTLVVRAWRRLPGGAAVLVGEALPEELVAAQARLAAGGVAYERLKLERPTITATVVLGFGGLALLVTFAAIWLGLYLSRRFTAPLLALAATTQRVAGGESLETVPLPAEDEVGMLVGSFNSMVQRLREREGELQATVRRLDAVLGAIRTGVLTIDAERQHVLGNPAAAAMLGVPELATGGVTLDALGAAGLARLAETIRSAESAVRGSLTIYPGGVARHLEMAVVPLGSAERPEGWVVAVEDLTQLLRAQRQAAWSEVARRIAHQIKNPLTPIRLAAERMARHVERSSAGINEVVSDGSRAIVEHVQAMQEMVDSFARYAKMPPLARRPVPIGELARQVVALYQGVREQLSVVLVDHSGGRDVLIDPEQFRQVITNLVDNAVEASPADGEVVVGIERDGEEVVVSVTDQGTGLPAEDPEMLFQPFYSTKGRGSGVGLAMVQRIVTDHGGTVRLEANQPQGVRAEVRIPGGEG
ncbi:MAG: HAMP domain-containing protein [Acidobacteriia bacterium]|nr:HAMP domain-containing protein [Terriglobia bacterium]